MDDDRGVVELSRPAQRGADNEDGKERARGLCDAPDRPIDGVQQRVLEQEVVDRIGGQGKFGEQHQADIARMAFGGEFEMLPDGEVRIGHLAARHARRQTQETLPIHAMDIGHRTSQPDGRRPCRPREFNFSPHRRRRPDERRRRG